MIPRSFTRYVTTPVENFAFKIALVVSIMVGLGLGLALVFINLQNERRILDAISPHLSSLVEIQDRFELQRLLKGIASTGDSSLILIQKGIIIASSGNLDSLDREYVKRKNTVVFGDLEIALGSIRVKKSIYRKGGPILDAEISSDTPMTKTYEFALLTAALFFLAGILIQALLMHRLKNLLKTLLEPVKQLEEAIGQLKQARVVTIPSFQIDELQSIRNSIIDTHKTLLVAQDQLVLSRAKDLATETYKRTIHDLKTPIEALRNWAKIAKSSEYEVEDKNRALMQIPDLADQILNQIKMAKTSINRELDTLVMCDLRSCLNEASNQAEKASEITSSAQLESALSSVPILISHDPNAMRRAFTNLIANAFQSSATIIKVSATVDNGEALVAIDDNGSGLNIEEVGLHIQGRGRSSKEDRQSMGIAAANHTINLHGGNLIYRQSQLGGARFEVRLRG